MNLILLGAPGAGKGTQATEIKNDFNVVSISTGDLLREEVKKNTELGVNAKGFMDKGELVPDSVIVSMLEKRIKEPDCKNGFILDGFPRNEKQAGMLDALLEKFGVKLNIVLNVNVNKDSIIRRITNRLACSVCNQGYNKISKPPKIDGVCDVCGGTLVQRDDDNEETISKRLDVYEKQTAPLINYYKEKNLLFEVNGERDISLIYSDIKNKLKSLTE